jgi:hypothetical protein
MEALMKKGRENRFLVKLILFFVALAIGLAGPAQMQGQESGGADSERSAGQVASVFDEQPEWLQWIATKSKKSKSQSSSSWGTWWGGTSGATSRSPVSSYRRDNKSISQRMWISTKRAWNTTTSWLDPYPDPKPSSATRPAKKSWFSGWSEAWTEKDKKPSQSVSEFIGQEHPK